jgi:hypothetical protein
MDAPLFKHPFSTIVSGPSQSGKTQFVSRLLENVELMVDTSFAQIYYCYSEWQASYSKIATLPNVQMVEGVPNLQRLKEATGSSLVVIDDLMAEISKSPTLTAIFTKAVHHWNLSCIHIVQNLFYANTRTARINASYIILFKSPGDRLQVSTLARQMFPGQTKMFVDVFRDCTSDPYGYLVIDLTQTTDDQLRLRTKIFPGEQLIVYVPL